MIDRYTCAPRVHTGLVSPRSSLPPPKPSSMTAVKLGRLCALCVECWAW